MDCDSYIIVQFISLLHCCHSFSMYHHCVSAVDTGAAGRKESPEQPEQPQQSTVVLSLNEPRCSTCVWGRVRKPRYVVVSDRRSRCSMCSPSKGCSHRPAQSDWETDYCLLFYLRCQYVLQLLALVCTLYITIRQLSHLRYPLYEFSQYHYAITWFCCFLEDIPGK